jgi:hypothetical protein
VLQETLFADEEAAKGAKLDGAWWV